MRSFHVGSTLLLHTLIAASLLADCRPIPIDRTESIRARIDDTSCVDTDGKKYLLFTVNPFAEDILWVTVQPTPGSPFANPSIEIIPPSGDPSAAAPRVSAPVSASVRFAASPGLWTIRVGGQPGEFLLAMRVKNIGVRDEPQCIYELLTCDSTATWALSPQHCTYDGGRHSATFRMWGSRDDVVTIDLSSSAFAPVLFVRPKDSLTKLASAEDRERAVLHYRFPASDLYDIEVAGVPQKATGPFTLRVACMRSGCTAPSILSVSGAGRVPYRRPATLSVTTVGFPASQFEWFDATALPAFLKASPTFTTPSVDRVQSYTVRAFNPCGEETSNIISVVPDVPRRRAAP